LICLFVDLFICLFVYLFIRLLFICLFVCLFVYLSQLFVYSFICLFVYSFICFLFICLFVCLFVYCLFVYLFVCLLMSYYNIHYFDRDQVFVTSDALVHQEEEDFLVPPAIRYVNLCYTLLLCTLEVKWELGFACFFCDKKRDSRPLMRHLGWDGK
jgi:hypothetical protein